MQSSILFVRNFPAALCASIALNPSATPKPKLKLVGSWNIFRHLKNEIDNKSDKIIVIDVTCKYHDPEHSLQSFAQFLKENKQKFHIEWYLKKDEIPPNLLNDPRIHWKEFDQEKSPEEFRTKYSTLPPTNLKSWIQWAKEDQMTGQQCLEAAYFQYLVVQQFRTLTQMDEEIYELLHRWRKSFSAGNSKNSTLSENERKHAESHQTYGEWYVAGSPKGCMGEIIRRLNRYAKDPGLCRVLIRGKTGTGKELAAKHLHFCSELQTKPFVAVNCANFTEQMMISELFGHVKGAFTGAVNNREGLIQKAEGGTLFLDEVADLNLELQARLLRFLQEGTYSPLGSDEVKKSQVRIISASCKDIHQMVLEGTFREDLYWRLAGAVITMPSIQELITYEFEEEDADSDLQYIVDRIQREIYLARKGQTVPLKEEDWDAIWELSWPGNVRQLRAVLQSYQIENWNSTTRRSLAEIYHELSVYEEDEVEESDDNEEVGGLIGALDGEIVSMEKMQQLYTQEVLEYCGGNKAEALRKLDLSRNTLGRYLGYQEP